MKFNKAVHATAKSFKLFDDPLWNEFFSSYSKWKIIHAECLGGEKLDIVYDDNMLRVCENIRSSGEGTLSTDGATDKLATPKSNVILHKPLLLVIE